MQCLGGQYRRWACVGSISLLVATYCTVWAREALPYRFFPGGDPVAYHVATAQLGLFGWRSEYLSTDMTLALMGRVYGTFLDQTPSLLAVWTITCHGSILVFLAFLVYRLTASLMATWLALLLFATSAWPTTYLFFWSYAPIAALYGTGTIGALLLSVQSGRPWCYLFAAGFLAALTVWSCASGAVLIGGACVLALYLHRPWRGWSETLAVIVFFGTLLVGFAPFLLSHFREGYVYHVQENFTDGHLRAALNKFGRLPPPPSYYAPFILSTYSPAYLKAFGLATLSAICAGWFYSPPMRRVVLGLGFIVWAHILVVEHLPTTKLARSYFIVFPLMCAFIAVCFAQLRTVRTGAAKTIAGLAATILIALSCFQGLTLSHAIAMDRRGVASYLTQVFPEKRRLYLLDKDPHAAPLIATLGGACDTASVDPSYIESLPAAERSGLVLVVGPTGPGSGTSILRNGTFPDFDFDVQRFAKATGAQWKTVRYYAYNHPFCLEEENCQTLLYNHWIPKPLSRGPKNVTILSWPSTESMKTVPY
jgi:hypothetical protein